MKNDSEALQELLVVGAGPVGLVTALFAQRAGLNTTIIDREWRVAPRSYACTLHPATLELLDQLDLLAPALELGRRVDTVAFHEGARRLAEISLSSLPAPFPFALVLYQDDFEGLLEDALRERGGIKVEWGCRLAGMDWENDLPVALLERLMHRPTGDLRRRWQEEVDRRLRFPTRYIAGADGRRSQVAHVLGSGDTTSGQPSGYAIYEFEPRGVAEGELSFAVEGEAVHALWPLPDGTCRWILEGSGPESPAATPTPDVAPVVPPPSAPSPFPATDLRRWIEGRIQAAAPWFQAGVQTLDWALEIDFPKRVARQRGRGGCWLLGDAAHQTAPGGAQSMNVGLLEAREWVEVVRRILRDGESPAALASLADRWESEWHRLLGLAPAPAPIPGASPSAWVQAHSSALVANLPLSRAHLDAGLAQLGLAWVPGGRPS